MRRHAVSDYTFETAQSSLLQDDCGTATYWSYGW